MFKFKGFLNPFTEEGRVEILKNTIKSYGVDKVRVEVLSSKRKEMNKLVRATLENKNEITAGELIEITINCHPKFREFFDKELGFGDRFWKTQAKTAISNKGK